MAITSVASSVVFLPSAEAADVIESAAPSSRTVSSATPAVINSVSNGAGPGTTSADIQSRISGINALIQSAENIIWSAGDPSITPQEIAQAQSTEAQHLLAGEGATIAFADEQGVQGVSFDVLPIKFPAPTSGSQSSSAFNPVVVVAPAAAPSSVAPPSSTALPAASSQSQRSTQTPSPSTSSGTSSPSTSAADVALSVLKASGQQPDSPTATTQSAKQSYDIYA